MAGLPGFPACMTAGLLNVHQNVSKIKVKKSNKSLQMLRKSFREPAREARRPPEAVPSSGARSAPELGTSSRAPARLARRSPARFLEL